MMSRNYVDRIILIGLEIKDTTDPMKYINEVYLLHMLANV